MSFCTAPFGTSLDEAEVYQISFLAPTATTNESITALTGQARSPIASGIARPPPISTTRQSQLNGRLFLLQPSLPFPLVCVFNRRDYQVTKAWRFPCVSSFSVPVYLFYEISPVLGAPFWVTSGRKVDIIGASDTFVG